MTTQFSFNYATSTGQESESKTVEQSSSEKDQDSTSSEEERSDALIRTFSAGAVSKGHSGSSKLLPEGSTTAHLSASNLVRESATLTATDGNSALSMLSSEDGGVPLPLSSTSGSMNVVTWAQIGPRNLSTVSERHVRQSVPTNQQLENNAVIRSATARDTAHTRIGDNLIARGLSATTDHQQYASYRRQYDRDRNARAIASQPMPPPRAPVRYSLTSQDCERCSEPWALSSIISWLKDMLSDGFSDYSMLLMTLGQLFSYIAKKTHVLIYPHLLSDRVLNAMFANGTLFDDGEVCRFTSAITTGVLVQLTGDGCYSPLTHAKRTGISCYSPRCLSKEDSGIVDRIGNALIQTRGMLPEPTICSLLCIAC